MLSALTYMKDRESRRYYTLVLCIAAACLAESLILSQLTRSDDGNIGDIPYYIAFSESSAIAKFFWHFFLGIAATAITVLFNMPWTLETQEQDA